MRFSSFDDYSAYNIERLADIFAYVSKGRDGTKAARELIERFETLDNCFAASVEELESVVGKKTAVFVKVLAAITSRRITDNFEFGKAHGSAEIGEYFAARLLSESVEVVLAMYLDSDGRAVACRAVGEGTVNMSDIVTRKILEYAVEFGCSRIILAHNHPRGVAQASADDVNMTAKLSGVLRRAGMTLEYHLVVAGMDCDAVDYEGE